MQYFFIFLILYNIKNNLADLNAFAKVVKVTNHARLWDALFTWYSKSATCQICLYGLEHNLGSYGFGLSDLVWSLMFLQPEQSFLNYLVIVLWSFGSSPFVVLWLSLNSEGISSQIRLLYICVAFKLHQCTNYHDNTNQSRYLSQL